MGKTIHLLSHLYGRRLALEVDPLAESGRERQVIRPWSFEIDRLKS